MVSLLLGGGFGAFLVLPIGTNKGVVFYTLAPLLVAASVLGLFVSIRGCNACVARIFGSA
jgi:hypothetical protein